MRLNPVAYGAITVSLFLVTVFGFKAAGAWSVSGKVTASGELVQPGGTNVDEIKGWMKLGDVATAYSVPVDEILVAFGLPLDTASDKQLKELESDSFSPATLRDWLKNRMAQ